ncbi:MAG TPA: AsmA family protein, partial [Rhizomicrobium sp.]|nr:AsmA family protein [Rhizomicrobium sp.]
GLALLIFLLLTLDWDTMRGPVSRFVSARMGREVHINGHLRVHLFSWQPWLTAEKITVGNPKWLPNSQMGSADKLTIKVRLLPLVFEQRAIFPLISVDKPDVALIRDRAGHANWSFSDPETTNPGAMSLPPIEQFIINDGHVTMQDDKAKMSFDGTFSSHEATGGQTKNNIFVLDGKGRLRGAPLTASVRGGPLIHVDPNKPYALNVDVHHGGTHIVATGSLERPFDLNRMTAAARLSGPSLADLYFLTGLAMPNTAPYQLRTIFTRDGKFYRLAKLHGTVGKSDLFGEMSVDTGSGRPFLKASLESKSLAFSDLGPMIGSTPNGATVRVKATGGETKTVVSNTRVLPDMPLRVERVRGMDAIVDYKADTIRSQDFPLRQLLLHLTLDHGVMRMDPLAFTFPQGKLTSHIKIDARKDIPVNDVDARITDIQLAQFFGGKSAVLGGTMEARAKLHAAGDSIHKAAAAANGTVTAVIPNGTVRKAYAELSGIDITPGLFELLGNDKSDT